MSTTYAIIETGSKQYRVEPESVIQIEKIDAGDKKTVDIDRVLLLSDGKTVQIGNPVVKGAKVVCEVIDQIKGKKVVSFRYRRRKDSKRKVGHRQPLTQLRVKSIKG